MNTTGKLFGELSLPQSYVGEIVASSIRNEGWDNLAYSALTDEITARWERKEKKGDLNFSYDYRLKCCWLLIDEATELTRLFIEIVDRENQSRRHDCEELAYRVIVGIKEAGLRSREKIGVMPRPTTYGADRWAEPIDLSNAGYLKTATSIEGNAAYLGPYDKMLDSSWRLVLPEPEACRHILVCGPTGCGKTSSVFIPNIIERSKYSAIITEATAGDEPPDLYRKTSGYRLKQGHEVYYFNPNDLASVRINPIDGINSVEAALNVAELIMQNTESKFRTGGDKFWKDAETHLLASLIMHVAPIKGHLGMIRSLVREGPERIAEILSDSPIDLARREYKAFLNITTENIQKGVLIGLLQRLNYWVDPKIVALTEKTDIDFARLQKGLFTIYLAVPASKQRLKPVASLILNYLIQMAEDKEFSYKINLFLDEFTNFGHLPNLPGRMGIIRHKKIPVMLGCQDHCQIRIEYGEDPTKALFNNVGTQFIFRTKDLQTARHVSEALGQETVVKRELDTSCRVTERELGKPLMRPSEVMAMAEEESIVFTPNTPPIRMKRFSWKDYVEQTSHPSHRHELQAVDDSLEMHCRNQAADPQWRKEIDTNQLERSIKEDLEKIAKEEQINEPSCESHVVAEDNSQEELKRTKSSATRDPRAEEDFDVPL